MRILKTAGLTLALFAVLVTPASADTIISWHWDHGDTGSSSAGGRIDSVDAVYNVDRQTLDWSATFRPYWGRLPNGFTLAVNDGGNPKGHAGEMALFYYDASDPTPVLTAYAYNGSSALTSYFHPSPVDRIQSTLLDPTFASGLTYRNNPDGTRTLGFAIDVSTINGHTPRRPGPGGVSEWSGAAFEDYIGVWFHPSWNVRSSYSGGWLNFWSASGIGWLDTAWQRTETRTTNGVIPEPSTWLLLGLGVLGLAGARFRSRRSLA